MAAERNLMVRPLMGHNCFSIPFYCQSSTYSLPGNAKGDPHFISRSQGRKRVKVLVTDVWVWMAEDLALTTTTDKNAKTWHAMAGTRKKVEHLDKFERHYSYIGSWETFWYASLRILADLVFVATSKWLSLMYQFKRGKTTSFRHVKKSSVVSKFNVVKWQLLNSGGYSVISSLLFYSTNIAIVGGGGGPSNGYFSQPFYDFPRAELSVCPSPSPHLEIPGGERRAAQGEKNNIRPLWVASTTAVFILAHPFLSVFYPTFSYRQSYISVHFICFENIRIFCYYRERKTIYRIRRNLHGSPYMERDVDEQTEML